jgi:hypothetical protein
MLWPAILSSALYHQKTPRIIKFICDKQVVLKRTCRLYFSVADHLIDFILTPNQNSFNLYT